MRIRSATYHWTIPISLLLIAWVTVARAYDAPPRRHRPGRTGPARFRPCRTTI